MYGQVNKQKYTYFMIFRCLKCKHVAGKVAVTSVQHDPVKIERNMILFLFVKINLYFLF